MKKMFFCMFYCIVIFSIVFLDDVSAKCEYSQISRLKSIVSNINLIYDYYISDNKAYFNITISNIVPEIYFVDSNSNITYTYNDTIDGEIVIYGYRATKGAYRFYSALNDCYGTKLSNKYYQMPTYNNYYTDPLCQENKNYSLCQKWAKVNHSYSELKKSIEMFKKENNAVEDKQDEVNVYRNGTLQRIVTFYTKNYFFILIGIIVICLVVMFISRKKNRFDI